jgi:hypothetical protein
MPDQRLRLPGMPENAPKKILVKAETFKDADAKQKMREIAVKYVKFAEQLECAAAD